MTTPTETPSPATCPGCGGPTTLSGTIGTFCGNTPTLTSEIARVVHLGYVADEYAEATDAEYGPDAVSDDAGDLGDTLRQLGGRLRWLVNKQEAEHRAVSTVLAAVVEALTDPARPEESPVDAVRRLRAEVERLRRDLCQAWGRADCGQRFPSQADRDRAARAVAKRQGWDCYPEDSTTVEPTLHDCIGMAEALAEGDEESPI